MSKNKSFFKGNLFRKTKELENKITAFLLNIIQAGVLYNQAMDVYIQEGCVQQFLSLRKQVSKLESENDSYRREIENDLYAHMLLPDMRSDILKLLEGCDKVINKYESNLLVMSVEKPVLISTINKNLPKLIEADLECVSALIAGVKGFFEGQEIMSYTLRTYQYEHTVDKQAFHIKGQIFDNKTISLAHKLQLKEFIYNIEKISDIAEDVADILKIMAVKHAI